MTRVGNHTNSPDPQSVNSRLFVGNLNTYSVTKEELGRVFQRYGSVIGISMHKGYAFVQFTDTWDARNAIMGEDGRTLAGQVLDVNMVSEPKPHQITRKRQGSASSTCTRQVSPAKRLKSEKAAKKKGKLVLSTLHRSTYNNPDILICGNCKELFDGIQAFFEHKKQNCKLRFSCKCEKESSTDAPTVPVCMKCETKCSNWWDLVQHAEIEHNLVLYRKQEVTNIPSTSGDGDQELSDAIPEEFTVSWGSLSEDGDATWSTTTEFTNGDANCEKVMNIFLSFSIK
ncbi:uncharacterized RNA-binding protein C3H8.09c-like [Centruroides sculpturatus]|uniref:uncharacterized RNA-binding protein C3H8.09c-like n=1 Tax=Centruroides sculpturatus TaxID=218467 RepID=UPI000C6E4D13|nr:uncharacterized RNA-binding protein C3H8.09c-like [Centruroides sculpturatus]